MSEDVQRRPERSPDEELYGEGATPEGIKVRAEEAYYAEVYIDHGDPIHAPRGWWHAKIWKRP